MFGVDDAALAILIGGLASSAGALYSNSRNLKYQSHVNDVNWQIAAMNNATQIDMANSAHQREVADLRAAGLNPILSAGGSGASTPSLTSLRGDSAQIENPVEGLASSARGLAQYLSKQYSNNLQQQEADIAQTKANTAETDVGVRTAKREFDLLDLQVRNDLTEEQLRAHALKRASGLVHRPVFDKDGNFDGYRIEPEDDDSYRLTNEVVDEMADGYRAKWRDATNLNWRNNVRAISGAVGDAASALSGAGSFLRNATLMRKLKKYNNLWY